MMKRFRIVLILVVIGTVVLFYFRNNKTDNIITYNQHISSIIDKHCISCHQPGFVAPFSLLTYKDVRRKAKTIAEVTRKRYMPPWPADPSYSHFIGENVLTDEEIQLIAEWIDNGSPEGEGNKSVTPPLYSSKTSLGKPDLVLKVPPYTVKNDDLDRFLLMKIPYEIDKDTFVKAVEFVPGSRYVHHVNGHLLSYNNGEKKNVFEGRMYLDMDSFDVKTAYEKMALSYDDGTYPLLTPSFVNYLPGVTAAVYPHDIGGFKLSHKGAVFFKDIHFGPSTKTATDTSQVNIYFTDSPPQRQLLEVQLGTLGVSPVVPDLVIPANQVKTFTTELRVPHDISLVTINPHMHLIGKTFKAYAVTPSQDTIKLIRINNWDFRWQYFYTFPKMIKIPKGSVIKAEGLFDNTNNNPLNPFNPPRTITGRDGSMKVTDEMFQLIINYVPYQKGDELKSLAP